MNETIDDSPVLVARGLGRRFGRVAAVQDLSLELPRGEILGLVGDRGAGKSTTLRMALGLVRPSAGELRVLGLDPATRGVEVRCRSGYVPEDRRLYPGLRVGRLVRFAASFHPGWDPAREGELLERFGLDDRQRVGALSPGDLTRLYLVLALAPRPELLVLDEPTGDLDASARGEILAALADLVLAGDLTILLASRALPDVERVADRIAVMRRGQLLECGPLDALRQRFARVHVRFAGVAPRPPAPGVAGVRSAHRRRSEWWLVTADPEATRNEVAGAGVEAVEVQSLSLEELFVELVRSGPAA